MDNFTLANHTQKYDFPVKWPLVITEENRKKISMSLPVHFKVVSFLSHLVTSSRPLLKTFPLTSNTFFYIKHLNKTIRLTLLVFDRNINQTQFDSTFQQTWFRLKLCFIFESAFFQGQNDGLKKSLLQDCGENFCTILDKKFGLKIG